MNHNHCFLYKLVFVLSFSFFYTNVKARQNITIYSCYFSSFDSTKIYYEVRGNGFPVLLVHGFIVNSNSWKHAALYDSLLTAGNKVILIDMRGNGKSGKPHNETSYQNDAEAKDIMLLMKSLNINRYDCWLFKRFYYNSKIVGSG